MTDRPILYSGPMVRALLDGRKTQTRRIAKFIQETDGVFHIRNSGGGVFGVSEDRVSIVAPDFAPYSVGDHLWVREAWLCNGWAADVATILYRASEGDGFTAMCEQFPVKDHRYIKPTPGKWKPGIHMPRWASRITQSVVDVRVQRLQDITEADAIAEGCPAGPGAIQPLHWYRDLWDDLNADRGFGWDTNPWVVAVSFTVERRNIDQVA